MNKERILDNKPQIAKQAFATYSFMNNTTSHNPWASSDFDKLDILDYSKFKDTINMCRFYYKCDPIASTVINKLVDIGITGLEFTKNGLEDNTNKVFEGLEDKLLEFAQLMALELLVSGIIVPEIIYAPANKDQISFLGVKRYDHLILPMSMWLRDPTTIKIDSPVIGGMPSYYASLPESFAYFIMNKGVYQDGRRDDKLYAQLQTYYPDFVLAVRNGQRDFLLDNPLIIRRKYTTESPYPIPYLYNALESLKHKRNLKRMDYALAARVVGAIQLFQIGNDNFPVTEDQQGYVDYIKNQVIHRESGNFDVERIFQLFVPHIVDAKWVIPPLEALLSENKYKEINQDILIALGFPGILLTGETTRSNASSPEMAVLSPIKTMESIRSKVLFVIKDIVQHIADDNNFKKTPNVTFSGIDLSTTKDLITALQLLYDSGNISRHTIAEKLGYDWDDETALRISEKKILDEAKLDTFAPKPFSPQPGQNQPNSGENQPPQPAPVG